MHSRDVLTLTLKHDIRDGTFSSFVEALQQCHIAFRYCVATKAAQYVEWRLATELALPPEERARLYYQLTKYYTIPYCEVTESAIQKYNWTLAELHRQLWHEANQAQLYGRTTPYPVHSDSENRR